MGSCAAATNTTPEIPELLSLAHTLDTWRDELLAYFDTGGVSNGPTKAINGLIKKITQVDHSYGNFANDRLASCCTAESPGTLRPSSPQSEGDYHAWLRRARLPGHTGLSRPRDVACHSAEDCAMERPDRPPVQMSEQPTRVEQRALCVDRRVTFARHAHLEPSEAG